MPTRIIKVRFKRRRHWIGTLSKKPGQTVSLAVCPITFVGKSIKQNLIMNLTKTAFVCSGKSLLTNVRIYLTRTALGWSGKTFKINTIIHLIKTSLSWTGQPMAVLGAQVITLTKGTLSWVGMSIKASKRIVLIKTALVVSPKIVYIHETVHLVKRGIQFSGQSMTVSMNIIIELGVRGISWVGKTMKSNIVVRLAKTTLNWVGKAMTIVSGEPSTEDRRGLSRLGTSTEAE